VTKIDIMGQGIIMMMVQLAAGKTAIISLDLGVGISITSCIDGA
jgi:hypothetical protein